MLYCQLATEMNIWFEHLKYMYGSIIDNAFKTSYNQLYTLTKMKYKVQINILLHLAINLLVIKKTSFVLKGHKGRCH